MDDPGSARERHRARGLHARCRAGWGTKAHRGDECRRRGRGSERSPAPQPARGGFADRSARRSPQGRCGSIDRRARPL